MYVWILSVVLVTDLAQVQRFDAGHLFYRVGLTPCNLATASASLGIKFTIPFSVYDDGSPQLKSTVNRTLLIVAPCSAGMMHVCMPTGYTLLLSLQFLTDQGPKSCEIRSCPHICW